MSANLNNFFLNRGFIREPVKPPGNNEWNRKEVIGDELEQSPNFFAHILHMSVISVIGPKRNTWEADQKREFG